MGEYYQWHKGGHTEFILKFISKGLKILFVDKIPERFIIKIGAFFFAAGLRVKKFGMVLVGWR